MMQAISIVGHSKSGKTTLMEHLIRELKKRGRRVAAVKHAHDEFDLDRPGKDSWRYAEAGADAIALLGARRSALLRSHHPGYDFNEILLGAGGDADVVLIEGLSGGPHPKIETYRGDLGLGLRCDPEQLLAVVTEDDLEIDCKRLSPQEIGVIADVVERQAAARPSSGTELLINGLPLEIGSFTQKIIANTILGLVRSLKGVDEISTLSVRIRTAGAGRKDAEGHR
jgi:molybdopterin-guanine dinucleotide biosynthesis protein B